MRIPLSVVLVAAAVLSLGGCLAVQAPEQQPPGPVDQAPQPTGPSDALLGDLDTAVAITDEWWTAHWSDFFTGEYESPNVVGLYDGRDEENAPTCGGRPLGPNNAFYCSAGDFVAWDVSLMVSGYELGDAWAYLVVAHEWGHAIQARLDSGLVAATSELQADCLAGASIFGAAADGLVTFEAGDQAEIATGLSTLGDETPWTNSGDHGDPFQRIAAFDDGRTNGVPACFPAG